MTGLSRADLRTITWKEVDLDAGLITRPRHKTGIRLRLPMSEPLREVLERQPQRSGLVCRGLPKSDSSLYKALHRLMDRAEVPRSGWHHLRQNADSRVMPTRILGGPQIGLSSLTWADSGTRQSA